MSLRGCGVRARCLDDSESQERADIGEEFAEEKGETEQVEEGDLADDRDRTRRDSVTRFRPDPSVRCKSLVSMRSNRAHVLFDELV